ncbi:MAG: hypothetical protein M9890_09550 [Thermomicrobiales bacterium]|nr:hypothetical protein [Thermomicrobiales bacterium]
MLTRDLMAAVDAIYDISGSPTIEHHIVQSNVVKEFVYCLRVLKRATFEDRDNAQIRRLLNILFKYQYLVTSTPIAPSDSSLIGIEGIAELKTLTSLAMMAYRAHRDPIQQMVNAFLSLYYLNSSPLSEYLMKHMLADDATGLALLVSDTRLVEPTQRALSAIHWLDSAEVLTPRDLRRLRLFDDLVIFGPLHRLPNYIMTASRARSIHVIRYRCIRDAWEPTSAFENPIVSRRRLQPTVVDEQDGIEDEWQPDADVTEVVRQLTMIVSDTNGLDVINARVALLANSHVVLLDANPSATELIIDLDADHSPIQRVAAHEVHAGTFILLRTDGSGDYVVTIADQIMGQRAELLRARQRRWKNLLRDAVGRSDLLTVALQLLDRGSNCADEQNVRNWMSHRSISTQAREDFDSIMKLIGLDSESEQYWQSMREIRRAHQRAGQRIRKLLLARVLDADLDELERIGALEFHLDEVDGGTLTAFRVERLLPQVVQVLPRSLGNPYSTTEFNSVTMPIDLQPLYRSFGVPSTIPSAQQSLDLDL